jgi:hypothetical protein
MAIKLVIETTGRENLQGVEQDLKGVNQQLNKTKIARDNETNSMKQQGNWLDKLKTIRKEEKQEQRLQNFVLNQGRELYGAAALALTAFGLASEGASSKQKQASNSINEGFLAFQGLSFALSAVPFGGFVAGAVGAIIAIRGLSDNTKDMKDNANSLITVLNKIGNQDFNQLVEQEKLLAVAAEATLMLTKSEEPHNEKKIKYYEDLVKRRNVYVGVLEAEAIKQNELNAAIKESQTLTPDTTSIISMIENQIKYNKEKMNQAKTEEELKKYRDWIYYDEQRLAAIRKPQAETNKENADKENKAAKARIDAWQKGQDEYNDRVEAETKRVLGNQDAIDKDFKSKRIALSKGNYDAELALINEWEASIINSTDATEDQKTEAARIASQERVKLAIEENNKKVDVINKTQEAQKKSDEELLASISLGADAAMRVVNTVTDITSAASEQRIANMEYERDKQLKEFDIEKEARLAVFDSALENDNLTTSQRKKLEKDRTKAEADENVKRKALEKKLQDDINAEKIKAWQVNKALSLSAAIISGAEAVAKAWAVMGPLGWVGAALTTAATAAQIAIIAAQEPPKFHTGGIVGQQPLRSDERVIIGQVGEQIIPKNQVGAAAGGITLTVNFNAPTDTEYVTEAIKKVLTETGKTIDKVFVNQNANISIG